MTACARETHRSEEMPRRIVSADARDEIDWLLAANLAWALRVEETARVHGVAVEEAAGTFACLRLLLQLRKAELS